MFVYLAQIVGAGVKGDGYRPSGVDGLTDWSMVDLRTDPTLGGLCLLGSQSSIADPGLRLLGQDKLEAFSGGNRTIVENQLGVTVTGASTLGNWLKELMFRDYSKWKPVMSSSLTGFKELWLAGQKWAEEDTGIRFVSTMDPSDDFNRANENPIVGNWTTGQGGNNLRIVTNRIGGNGSDAMAVWNANTFANDQWSQATSTTPVAGSFDGGTAVRGSLTSLTNYYLHGYSAGTTVYLAKWVAGVLTNLFSAAYTWTDGATIRTEAEGSTIRALVDGSTRTSGTDTSITSGYAGFWIFDSSYFCDDWSGGDISVIEDTTRRHFPWRFGT